jgi:hypothetical protein
MDDDITKSIQRYQSIVLLDLLIEFREEFVRRILSRWLRAEFMPESYERARYEKNIRDYFNRQNLTVELTKEFEQWRNRMGNIVGGTDETFKVFAGELNSSLRAIKGEFERFLALLPVEGRISVDDSDFTKGNIDRLREVEFTKHSDQKAEARRVGLAVDAFIRTPQFVEHLHPSRPDDPSPARYGLLAMFNLVLLAVDYSHPIEIKANDNVKRLLGGRFRYVLPPNELLFGSSENHDHLEDGRYSFQTFFPLVAKPEDAQTLEKALFECVRMCGSEMDQRDTFDVDNLLPAIFRGANTFVYDTNYAKPLFNRLASESGGVPHEGWTVHRNVNFIQLLPSPQQKIFGYFQMQSPLPGLVRALFPSEECGESWNRLYLEPDGNVSMVSPNGEAHESVVLVEMPRPYSKWVDHLENRHAVNDFVLEGIHWIRNSVTPWSRRFHNQMVYLDELKEWLWKSIEPKINERHRQQLELLRKPLENLSEALGIMQRDTQELRAVLWDPAKALFACSSRLAELFHENAEIEVNVHVRVMVSHSVVGYGKEDSEHDDAMPPRNRRETRINGSVILAFALCRIYGCQDGLSNAKSSKEVIEHANLALADKAAQPAFQEVTADLLWLLEVTNICQVFDEDKISRSLTTLKETLFDPYKLSARQWLKKVFELAVLPYSAHRNLVSADGSKDFVDMPEEWSPFAVHTVLAFIIDACAEAFSRTGSQRKVRSIKLERDGGEGANTLFRIHIVFDGSYLDSASGWSQLKQLLKQHILIPETRDWRIAESQAGNFRKPYIDLASRALGLGTTWSTAPVINDEELFCLHRSQAGRRFVIKLYPPSLSTSKTLTLAWEEITPP